MENHKTEREADAALYKILDKVPDWFCPMIEHTCKAHCVCYTPARKQMITAFNGLGMEPGKSWVIVPACCSNAMFFGAEEKPVERRKV